MSGKKLSIKIPNSLSDITLGEYQEYMKVVEANKDAEDTDFLDKKALQIFCKVPLKESMTLPASLFFVALERLSKCFEEKCDTLIRHFVMVDSEGKEQKMGFIPNLEKMSFGEYVDLQNYIFDWSSMHKAMAVLFRRITHAYQDKYLIADYEGTELYADAMKEMPVNIAIAAHVFFYRLGAKLSRGTLNYLRSEEDIPPTLKELLQKNGDGIQVLLQSQAQILLDSMRFQRFHSIEHLRT